MGGCVKDHDGTVWAKYALGGVTQDTVVPPPKQNIVAQELTIQSAKKLAGPAHFGFCHSLSAEDLGCHVAEDDAGELYEVSVTCENKEWCSESENVFVMWHGGLGFGHVLNVGDRVFAPPHEKNGNDMVAMDMDMCCGDGCGTNGWFG